jgi:DNA-binding MarR family transcriptional regulator
LMICVEVLCTLVSNGPMMLTQLKDKFEMDEARLQPHLRLLWNRGLVEEEKFGDEEPYYVVTERGLKVLKVVSPLIREAHKLEIRNFEAISNVLSGAGYS